LFGETLRGATTIRAYQKQRDFQTQNEHWMDENGKVRIRAGCPIE
jgi:hypothetical protein